MPDHITLDTLLRLLGRLHPMVVHFPIALLMIAALFEAPSIIRRGGLAGAPRAAIVPTALVLGTLSALVAVWFGWLNADFEGQRDDAVFWHRWLGVATAILALMSTIALFADRRDTDPDDPASTRRGARFLQRVALFATALVLTIGGHLGAALTYGDRYLISVFDAPDDAPVVDEPVAEAPPDALALLAAHCVECHGPDKQKARLRLDSEAMIFRGARDLWVIEPGDPEASVLVELITLPEDDPDRMPPEGAMLTPDEVETIRAWIRGVTPPSAPVADDDAAS